LKTDLTAYLDQIDLLNETVRQLEKDFAGLKLKIHFSGKPELAYDELFSQVLPHIDTLLKENYSTFYNLMYRIDISEDQIKKAMGKAIDKTFSEIITDLILKRELLKVVMRKKYS